MIFPNIKVQPYWLKTLEAAADAPVVLPEPDAYLYTSGNHRGVSLEWRGQSDMAEGTERHALYTEQQVRALLGGTQSTYKNEWEDIRTLPKTNH